jgi:adenylylsulfate reductase subunit B
MSIRIDSSKCTGCKKCMEVCPGNLIKTNNYGKAVIIREKDCWGCTSCLKECKTGAIQFFLGADIGGRGSTLSVQEKGNLHIWTITDPAGNTKEIEINGKDSNQY